MKIAYFCINLESQPVRRSEMQKQAALTKIDLRFIDAVWGKSLSYDQVAGYDRKRRLKSSPDLSLNELGCILSHKKTLLAFLESDADYAIILEDDAIFDENLDGDAQEIISHFPYGSVDYFKLHSHGTKGYSIKKTDRFEYLVSTMCRSAAGMMYSRTGAEKVLKSFDRFYYPYDYHFVQAWKWDLAPVMVWPPLIRTNPELESSIGYSGAAKYSNFLMQMRDRLDLIVISVRKKIYSKKLAKRLLAQWKD